MFKLISLLEDQAYFRVTKKILKSRGICSRVYTWTTLEDVYVIKMYLFHIHVHMCI